MDYNDSEFHQMLKDAEKLMRDAYTKGYLDGKAEVENRIRTESDSYKFGLLEGAIKYLETKARFVDYYIKHMQLPGHHGFPTYIEEDWTMPEHAAEQMLELGERILPNQEDSNEREEK